MSDFHRIILWEHWDTSFKKKKFYLFIEELYARLYHCYIFEAFSLLVYVNDLNSKGYNSKINLYFTLCLVSFKGDI